jgi:transposase InsO family protein
MARRTHRPRTIPTRWRPSAPCGISKTAEHTGPTSPTTGDGFLVQKHDATRPHYDFRLVSRRGNCHDNAIVEGFLSSLKRKRIRRRTYKTREEPRQDVFDYIEMFYNPIRKHVRNGMLSPVEFERQQALMARGV